MRWWGDTEASGVFDAKVATEKLRGGYFNAKIAKGAKNAKFW